MIKNAVLQKKPLRRDTIIYILSIIILYVTFKDGVITLYESLLYVVVYVGYIVLLSQRNKFVPEKIDNSFSRIEEEFEKEEELIEKKLCLVCKVMHWIDMLFDAIFPNLPKYP